MKDILLVTLIIVLSWIIWRGQMQVLKKGWKRTLYHYHQTMSHFAEVVTLVGVSTLGVLLVIIFFYAFYLGGS